MVFERIERIAVGVRDLKRAEEFFSSLLDIRFDEALEEKRLNLRAAYSAFGLELVEPTAPGSLMDAFIQNRGEGVFCIVIKVSDMDQAVRIFEDRGLKPAGEMRFGGLKEVAFHPKGCFGLQIVLAEYTEKHPATVAAKEQI